MLHVSCGLVLVRRPKRGARMEENAVSLRFYYPNPRIPLNAGWIWQAGVPPSGGPKRRKTHPDVGDGPNVPPQGGTPTEILPALEVGGPFLQEGAHRLL